MDCYVSVNFFWGGKVLRQGGLINYSIDPKQMQYVQIGTSYEELKNIIFGLMQISRDHWDVNMSYKYP